MQKNSQNNLLYIREYVSVCLSLFIHCLSTLTKGSASLSSLQWYIHSSPPITSQQFTWQSVPHMSTTHCFRQVYKWEWRWIHYLNHKGLTAVMFTQVCGLHVSFQSVLRVQLLNLLWWSFITVLQAGLPFGKGKTSHATSHAFAILKKILWLQLRTVSTFY